MQKSSSRWGWVLSVVIAGCSSTVTGALPDASADGAVDTTPTPDVPGDGPVCVLTNGWTCPAGARCPAGDGCNTCVCDPTTLTAQCTLLGCVPPDAGVAQRCTTASACPPGEVCTFDVGTCGGVGTCEAQRMCGDPQTYCACDGTSYAACQPTRPTERTGLCGDGGVRPQLCTSDRDCAGGRNCLYGAAGCGIPGVCEFVRDCAFIADYCGCDGSTFRDCPGGFTSRPFLYTGACASASDGGVAGCTGSSVGPDRRSCVGPDNTPRPLSCCAWSCNADLVACDADPPTCAPGNRPSVVDGCWGPCVPSSSCVTPR